MMSNRELELNTIPLALKQDRSPSVEKKQRQYLQNNLPLSILQHCVTFALQLEMCMHIKHECCNGCL